VQCGVSRASGSSLFGVNTLVLLQCMSQELALGCGNVSILEGSGGNIAVLTGPDGKVFIDAGITASRPRILEAVNRLSND
jgi:hypothetical protein